MYVIFASIDFNGVYDLMQLCSLNYTTLTVCKQAPITDLFL